MKAQQWSNGIGSSEIYLTGALYGTLKGVVVGFQTERDARFGEALCDVLVDIFDFVASRWNRHDLTIHRYRVVALVDVRYRMESQKFD